MKKEILTISLFSGLLMGLYTLFMKLGLEYEFIEYFTSPSMFKLFITNPFVILGFAFAIIGTYVFQSALHMGKSGLVNTFSSVMALLIVIIGGFFYLLEAISILKAIGIALIAIGTIIVQVEE